jgi:NADH dehydrogenase
MQDADILVIGGSGFVGRHLVAQLAARGARVTVAVRRPERARHLLLLPTVELAAADIGRRRALARLARGRDAVINLVGVLYGGVARPHERGPNKYGPEFARLHVELPQAIIAACRETGVKRLLHLSALGAAVDAPSEYLRSKGVGEQMVLAAEDLDVTVFRPSVIFGPEDGFLNLFARLARFAPLLAVVCPEARFQPVYVGDVAAACVAALDARESFGRRYDLCGPRVYTMKELVKYVCRASGRRRIVLGLPAPLSWALAMLLERLPGKLVTRDNIRSMSVPNVCPACPEGELPFGMHATALEAVAPEYLAPRR